MKQSKLFILILFKDIVNFFKGRLSGGDDLFYKWTNTFFSFENISFIAPGIPLTSTAITLLNLMIVSSLFYVNLNDTCESSFILERLSMTFTANGKNETFALSSALCTVESKYLYLL